MVVGVSYLLFSFGFKRFLVHHQKQNILEGKAFLGFRVRNEGAWFSSVFLLMLITLYNILLFILCLSSCPQGPQWIRRIRLPTSPENKSRQLTTDQVNLLQHLLNSEFSSSIKTFSNKQTTT